MPPVILIIDDSPDVTNIVALMLRGKGYEAITALSGADAFRLMEKQRPDLILCDIMMPDMDGFQVFQRVPLSDAGRPSPSYFCLR